MNNDIPSTYFLIIAAPYLENHPFYSNRKFEYLFSCLEYLLQVNEYHHFRDGETETAV